MADELISQLDAVDTADVQALTVFEVEVPGLADPQSRKLTLAQLQALVSKRVPFFVTASGVHTISAGVSRVDVEVIGGGGGAGTSGGVNGAGSGGGYAMAVNVAVVEGTDLTIVIGDGGASHNAAAGDNGTNTVVSNPGPVVIAEAGGGTGGSVVVEEVLAGGAGVTGDILVAGGDAVSGVATNSIPLHGGKGGGPWGGQSTLAGVAVDSNAIYGAGDGCPKAGADPGKQGGPGLAIIWEYQP